VTTTHTIAFAPAGRGRFDAFLGSDRGNRLIVANTLSPYLSGARALLAEGLAAPGDDVMLVYRDNPELLCLRATVDAAAREPALRNRRSIGGGRLSAVPSFLRPRRAPRRPFLA
jgi:hypothetical protein